MEKSERVKRNASIKAYYELITGAPYIKGQRVKDSDLAIREICRKHKLTKPAVYVILKGE